MIALRRSLLVLLPCLLSACAGALLETRGLQGREVQVAATRPAQALTRVNFQFDFNTEGFDPRVRDQLSYLRTADFANYFGTEFAAVLEHNGLAGVAQVAGQGTPATGAALLKAKVVEVTLLPEQLNRLRYQWTLVDAAGATLATWESSAVWGRSWQPDRNAGDLGRGVRHLALVALNTLAAQGLVNLSHKPAQTPAGATQAF